MNRAAKWTILIAAVALLSLLSVFDYLRSDYRLLVLTDKIYTELDHPEWSTRLRRAKALLPNYGSGDYRILCLVDVRRVSIPLTNATAFYEREGDRLGFKEFHVDSYAEAARKFHRDWNDMGLEVAQGEDILVLSQCFPTADGSLRRYKPVMPGAPTIKIAVFADGRVTVDGSATTVDSLRPLLKALAEHRGAVWFYEEPTGTNPTEQASDVLQNLAILRLPTLVFKRPDFSDAVGRDGKPIPQ